MTSPAAAVRGCQLGSRPVHVVAFRSGGSTGSAEFAMSSATRSKRDVVKLPHHEQAELCTTRPAYRQGKKLTAVKVYTASSESQHLIVSNVPALDLSSELRRLAVRFGAVKSSVSAARFQTEPFTDAFHLQYARMASARHAKRQLDNRNFYGGSLLAVFAPELESVAETRAKLEGRRRDIARRHVQPIGAQRPRRPMSSEQWRAADVLQSKRKRMDADNPSRSLPLATATAPGIPTETVAATAAAAAPGVPTETVAVMTAPAASARPRLVPRQVTVRKQIVYRVQKDPS